MAFAAKQPPDFTLNSLRGGMNDEDPPHILDDDQCVLAENVEFFESTLGERRRGCESVGLTASGLDDETHVVFLAPHLDAGEDVEETQLFAVSATENASTTVAIRDQGTWTPITPVDAIDPSFPEVLRMRGQSLHGKLYVCYKSDEDRMHVWDGETLRRTGLAPPPEPPEVEDSAGGGTFAEDRYYRVRFIVQDNDGDILRRSEPTEEVVITPSGSNDGVIIHRPPLVDEGETHWEIEASSGDGNFYLLATVDIDDTTYTDTTELATDYAEGALSEDIGQYELMESAKYVIAEQDRVIVGSSWEDPTHGSRIAWTPVSNATGVGNDERIPIDTTNFIDLDWQDGGELTGLSAPLNGVFYAFKHARIYKVQRTGNLRQAYEAFLLSPTRGAIIGSIVNGVDEYGRGCVYFLDPSMGPARISAAGLQYMHGLQGTWERVCTTAADVVAHGVYYPDKQQVHWWVAVDSNDSPNFKMVVQTTETRVNFGGTKRGWSIATGTIAEAWCSTIIPEKVIRSDTEGIYLSYRPYAGFQEPLFIQRCDSGDTDAGNEYQAIIRTKPYMLAGLLNNWGGMNAGLLAKANADSDIVINVAFIRDFGKETNTVQTDFVPELDEPIVRKMFDNLRMSESYAIQFEFADPPVE